MEENFEMPQVEFKALVHILLISQSSILKSAKRKAIALALFYRFGHISGGDLLFGPPSHAVAHVHI
jgi:hypothetical protein